MEKIVNIMSHSAARYLLITAIIIITIISYIAYNNFLNAIKENQKK